MIFAVYVTAGVLPAFLIFYGRTGKWWAFGAWFIGAATAVLAVMMNAFAMAPNNPVGQASMAGQAFPLALVMPIMGVWLAKRQRRYRPQ
jgi:hypothetical protein